MISIEIRGDKELLAKMKKLERANPAKAICKEMARFIVFGMKSRAPFWQGTLMNSIQSRMTSDGYNIHMVGYGEDVETGHRIEKGEPTELLTQWATDKLISPKSWLSIIKSSGWWVKPQPFIKPAMDSAIQELEPISMSVLNRTLRESGFR